MQPCVEDVTLTWKLPKGLKVVTLPTILPPVFLGERLIVYAVLDGSQQVRSEAQCLGQ